jgi:hypothetical protein
MTLAPINPLAHKLADKACARLAAAHAVHGLGLFRQKPDLDRDPALLARPLSGDLRVGSVSHGQLQTWKRPQGGTVRAFGLLQVVVPTGLPGILAALKELVTGLFRREGQPIHVQVPSFPLIANLGEEGLEAFGRVRHGDLHCSDHPNIWGPQMPVNGVPITIFGDAA